MAAVQSQQPVSRSRSTFAQKRSTSETSVTRHLPTGPAAPHGPWRPSRDGWPRVARSGRTAACSQQEASRPHLRPKPAVLRLATVRRRQRLRHRQLLTPATQRLQRRPTLTPRQVTSKTLIGSSRVHLVLTLLRRPVHRLPRHRTCPAVGVLRLRLSLSLLRKLTHPGVDTVRQTARLSRDICEGQVSHDGTTSASSCSRHSRTRRSTRSCAVVRSSMSTARDSAYITAAVPHPAQASSVPRGPGAGADRASYSR